MCQNADSANALRRTSLNPRHHAGCRRKSFSASTGRPEIHSPHNEEPPTMSRAGNLRAAPFFPGPDRVLTGLMRASPFR